MLPTRDRIRNLYAPTIRLQNSKIAYFLKRRAKMDKTARRNRKIHNQWEVLKQLSIKLIEQEEN